MELQKTYQETEDVMIVDDIETNLTVLSEMVKAAGYIPRPVTSAGQAMQAIELKCPKLILLDISMPDMDGYELCGWLKRDYRTRKIPVIFLSATNEKGDRIKGLRLGAVDFIGKPFEPEEVEILIHTHLQNYRQQRQLEEHNRRLYKMLNEQNKKMAEEKRNLIFSMARLSESKEDPSGTHIRNVAWGSRLLAMSLQLSPNFEKKISNQFIEMIEMAAPLHDMGKLSIHDNILLKPGKLSEEEWETIKTHAAVGADILTGLYPPDEQNEFLEMAIDIARFHHERWSGGGYPEGREGEAIPLAARIVAVVDVYDALISKHCYKEALSHEESVAIINAEAGRSLDPEIIHVFNKIQNKLKQGEREKNETFV